MQRIAASPATLAESIRRFLASRWLQLRWTLQWIVGFTLVAAFGVLSLYATWARLIQIDYRGLLVAAIGAVAVVWMLIRRGRLPRTALDGAIILWLLAFVISTVANLGEWRRISLGLWFAGVYLLLWYIGVDLIGNGRLRRGVLVDGFLLATIPLIGATATQLLAWLQAQAATLPRLAGTLENPNPLGTVALVLTFVALGRAFSVRGVGRIVAGVLALLGAIMILLSGSRGAWFGAVAGAIGFGAFILSVARIRLNVRYLVVAGTIIAGLLFLVSTSRGWFGDGRIQIYQTAISTFLERPLTGSGLFTFGADLLRSVGVIPTELPHAHAHNLFLNIAAELGLPGLAALALTGLGLLRMAQRNWRQVATEERWLIAGGVAAVVGFTVHHLFDTTVVCPAVAFAGLFALISMAAPSPVNQSDPPSAAVRPLATPRSLTIMLFAAGIVAAGAWDNYGYSFYLRGFDIALKSGVTEQAVQQFQTAIEIDPALPQYRLTKAFVEFLRNRPAEAQAEFTIYCHLEPYWQRAPHDASIAIGHYFRVAFKTSSRFWDAMQCPPRNF